jgi:hypothetical protein
VYGAVFIAAEPHMASSFEMQELLHLGSERLDLGSEAGLWSERRPTFGGHSSWVRYNGQSLFRPEKKPREATCSAELRLQRALYLRVRRMMSSRT